MADASSFSPLGWLGRQRGNAMAALVLISIVLPPLGEVLRPYLGVSIVMLLSIAFLRIDVDTFLSHIKNPTLVICASVWSAVAMPLIIAGLSLSAGLKEHGDGLFLGLILQGVSSPMMAAPAFAALMGLDATLVLVVLVASTVLTPFTAPMLTSLVGLELPLPTMEFGLTLFAIVAGSAALGLSLRRVATPERVLRYGDELDGLNIVFLLVFVAAVMGNVGVQFLAAPWTMVGLTIFAFVLFFAVLGVTYVVFLRIGRARSFALAMMMTQRNIGLMIAATNGVLPEVTWMYFAVSQIPIYLSPRMLAPLAKRVMREP
jgi:predicted Na+-dependent transporter